MIDLLVAETTKSLPLYRHTSAFTATPAPFTATRRLHRHTRHTRHIATSRHSPPHTATPQQRPPKMALKTTSLVLILVGLVLAIALLSLVLWLLQRTKRRNGGGGDGGTSV